MLDKPAGYVCATEDSRPANCPGAAARGIPRPGPLSRGASGQGHDRPAAVDERRQTTPTRSFRRRSKVRKMLSCGDRGARSRPRTSAAFAEGLTLADGTRCLPAGLEPLRWRVAALCACMEGKYHQVKRMLASRGKPVTRLRQPVNRRACHCRRPRRTWGSFVSLTKARKTLH